jgi:hypothetical protein
LIRLELITSEWEVGNREWGVGRSGMSSLRKDIIPLPIPPIQRRRNVLSRMRVSSKR